MTDLVKRRGELADALDKAAAAFRKARVAAERAKAAVLKFDEQHPAVMQLANLQAGNAKRKAVGAAAESEAPAVEAEGAE